MGLRVFCLSADCSPCFDSQSRQNKKHNTGDGKRWYIPVVGDLEQLEDALVRCCRQMINLPYPPSLIPEFLMVEETHTLTWT